MYVLFDIGGTKTRIGATASLDTIGETVSFATPLDFEEGMKLFQEQVAKLTGGSQVRAVAGGIRGPLSADASTIIENQVLTGWVEKPIKERIRAACGGAHTVLMNDTAVVGLGEAHFGAGKGYDIVAYHTVSTGVGGARIVAGSLDQASVGFEPGHQVIDADMTIRGAGEGADTLEELISGTAIEKRFGKKPYEIPQSDPVWDELAQYLAYGLKNTILYWSPDVIVLGGSMVIGDPRILREDIVKHTERALAGFVPVPPIVDATLADKGGLYGALAVLSKLE
jgi:predicted NBD/HSP70 family sugar kinase